MLQKFLPFLATALILIGLTSCRNNNSTGNNTANTADTITYKTVRCDSTYRKGTAALAYLVLTAASPEVTKRITDSLFAACGGKSAHDIMANGILEDWKEALDDNKIAVGKEEEGDEIGMPFYQNDSMYVVVNTPKMFAVAINNEVYTGGAHGMYAVRYCNFDPKTGKMLTLDEVLKPNARAALVRIAEKIFRKENGIKPNADLEEAGWMFPDNVFVVSDNWYLSDKGLFFNYNPYEIASYAQGTIELKIPMADLKDMLLP
jgi:hypothetical protein